MSGQKKKVAGHKRKRAEVQDATVPARPSPPPPSAAQVTFAERTQLALQVYNLMQQHQKGSSALLDFITTRNVDWAAVVGDKTLLYHMWDSPKTSLDETLATAFKDRPGLYDALTKDTSVLRLAFTGANQAWSMAIVDASPAAVKTAVERNSLLKSVVRSVVRDASDDPTGAIMHSLDTRASKLLEFTPDELITPDIVADAVSARKVEFLTALVPRLTAIDVASHPLLYGLDQYDVGTQIVATKSHVENVLATLRAHNKKHYEDLPSAIGEAIVDFISPLSILVASYLRPLVFRDD